MILEGSRIFFDKNSKNYYFSIW